MLWVHRQRGRRVESRGNLRKSRTQKCHSVEESADMGENQYLIQIRCFEMVHIDHWFEKTGKVIKIGFFHRRWGLEISKISESPGAGRRGFLRFFRAQRLPELAQGNILKDLEGF